MAGHFHWAGAAHLFLAAAEHLGVPQERVLRAAGLGVEDLPPSPGRIPWSVLAPLTQAALELTGEPALGLLANNHMEMSHLGVAGTYSMHVSPIRASQVVAYGEVWPRLTNMVRFHHGEQGGLVLNCLETVSPEPPFFEAHAHLFLALHVGAYRKLLGPDTEIDHISIRGTGIGAEDHASALIGCRVLTGQSRNWVAVPRGLLNRPLPLADSWLCEQIRPQYEAFLRLLDEERNTTVALRTALDDALSRGAQIDLEVVAKTLKTKSRTLQARLAAEGTAFTTVLDAIRKEFSLRQVSLPGMKLAAVAAQVGFSDPAAFNRAFRRWTGVTPKEWQEQRSKGG